MIPAATVFRSFSLGWDGGAGCTSFPYTYITEGLLGQELTRFVTAIGRQPINCSSVEIVMVQPLSGMTCGAYLGRHMSYAGGYLTNSDVTSLCQFCPFSRTGQFLILNFNIKYRHRWFLSIGISMGTTTYTPGRVIC
ncbi:hypothetical protein BDN67DRAFT_905040 [Paxillus ammoniavirescens]|nr:hypothetical protein BDN67DRAFT_905040 [Paxillus ammoniavirescens]